MRVTLKTVNEELAALGTETELAKGAGYFLFRGGEADEWIDRTVHVATISSLTMEQWIAEYERLKVLHKQLMTPAKTAPAAPVAKKAKPAPEAAAPAPAPEPEPPRPCAQKAAMLAELEPLHKAVVAAEELKMRAARDGRMPELAALMVSANVERGKLDRALVALRDHVAVHGC
jgi:hypothetical protein